MHSTSAVPPLPLAPHIDPGDDNVDGTFHTERDMGNVVRRSIVRSGPPLLLILFPTSALAGMPAPITLTDVARMRLETISFFLLALLIAALLIQWIWNGLRTSFVRLPRLSYLKALGLVVLWGLLFTVVLTMISGARELMTPGAWDRKGTTYRLKDADE